MRSGQLLLAGAVSVVGFAVAVAYCLATWSQPNRPIMLLLYATAVVLGGSVAVLARRLARAARARRAVMLTLTLTSVLLIWVGAYLDGGADAPVVLGFLPPMVLVAITVRPRLQVGLQGFMVGAYLALAVVGEPPRPGYVLLHVSSMLGIGVVCAVQAQLVARQRAELRAIARMDPLTGALNRRGLDELASSVRGPASAIIFDLDDFKQVNDTLGHAAGDELLRWCVAATRLVLRPGDAIARLGGDEFLIVLPGADSRTAAAVADRVMNALRPRIGGSAGTATAPADGETLEALMSHADQRLYDIKRGRARRGEQQHAV